MNSKPHLNQWLALAVAASSVVIAGCGAGNTPTAAQEQQPPSVTVLTVQPRKLTLSQDLPGRVVATRTAEVRARVAGIVLRRYFEEGRDVRAGQLLFTIDPAPSRAALSRAQGLLAQADATLADAQAVVTRYTPLVALEAVSQQDFDAARTALKNAVAARQTAMADVESARLNLDYTTVRAPVSGRIGKSLVTEGALVGQGEATPMATIQQLDPVYIDFTRPVADVVRAREAKTSGDPSALSVAIEGSTQVHEGRMLFTDASVDQATGQVAVRGEFPNADSLLLPGMYVRVKASDAGAVSAILVPQRVVQRGSDAKPNVLVLGADGTVEARAVKTGRMVGSEYHIEQGLAAGDRVIVGGAPVQPGATAVVAQAGVEQVSHVASTVTP